MCRFYNGVRRWPACHIASPSSILIFMGNQVHTQLTLRSKGPHLDRRHGDAHMRYVTLSCLVCQTVVYRVLQHTVSPDVENGDGPVLPNEDWAENEVLKSSTGWIEVSKQCLVRVIFLSQPESQSPRLLSSAVPR